MKVEISQMKHAYQIGRAGQIGILKIEGRIVTLAALVGESEMRESNETVQQAIVDAFGSDSVDVDWIGGGFRVFVFDKDFRGPIRDPEKVSLTAQKCFTAMMDSLYDSSPSPCDI